MTSHLDTSSSSDENTLYQLNTIKDNDMDYDIESDQDYAMNKYSEESSDHLSDFDDIDLHDGVEGDDNIDSYENAEGDDDNDSSDDYKWIKGDLATHLPDFQGAFGLSENVHLPSSPSPIDFFTLFLTPDVVNYIVEQSNLYALQQNLKQKPMDASDFYKLIGFLFYASVVKLPSKGDYWYQLSKQDIIVDNISRNRADELLRTLHFNNNILNVGKCDKIQPLLDLFNERCQLLVYQEEYLAIDEQMMGFKSKTAPTSLKQYMPKKPSKHGFKLWSKSGVSGYIHNVNLYSGSTKAATQSITTISNNSLKRKTRLGSTTVNNNQNITTRRSDTKALGVSGMVVIDLVKDVPPGTKIFVNNYFGSITLIRKTTELRCGIT